MKKLYAIGEALIDFIPEETGKPIREVSGFKPAPGGAPANVCGAFSKLGGESEMITELGDDPFGDKIIESFKENNIGFSKVIRTKKANTALAFVSLMADGNREFSFYRKPSADMLLTPEEVDEKWFDDAAILHFCSVALAAEPMRSAHIKAIKAAKAAGAIISFDPNLRFNLWDSKEALRETVREFLPLADVVKISDEELAFILGEDGKEYTDEEAAEKIKTLFTGDIKLIIYTLGSRGSSAFTKKASKFVASEKVKAIDTTGAGDGFIGSLLYQLYKDGLTPDKLEDVSEDKMAEYLDRSNHFSGESVQNAGAIQSYPTSFYN
ncbi:MAG: carbohydrate kinase [Eubacterium sp.]|nr:carbohydrate kinase [Eubacterium sp.]